ncbi:dihydropteroate synthase [Polaribacter pacificus]|uniref:Dihydropteroate synthase n=1 Tax=Polaribacter pacificus TaxID=1775173 RepID=A0A917MDJ7_9FLAO|nr:dihydropteroate synthase [Polaribacter pacificus]GGG96979.1 dihydropteroate synthase [Polaribacter pacificus]
MKTLNCKGTLIDLEQPKVMGILNVTPDSFFDGGKYKSDKEFLEQAARMLKEGATFIDVGAYSSRPGAVHISEDQELARLLPVIDLLIKNFPQILISVDTFRSTIAQKSIEHGAAFINDISAGKMDTEMFDTIAKLQVPYCIMHMQGTPQNMQKNPEYNNITLELVHYFSDLLFELNTKKINDIIIDVGFGFGKTTAHNFELLKYLEIFQELNVPVLAGLSRKSMLYKTLDISAKEALNATTSANTIALLNGANILRVHDVKEALEAINIVAQIETSNS